MTVSIAISSSSIAELLLAESALRHHLNANSKRLLTADRTPALIRLTCPAVAELAAELKASSTHSADHIIHTLTLTVPPGTDTGALRQLIEQAVAAKVGVAAYAGVDSKVAAHYATDRATALANIKLFLSADAKILPSAV
ncbi:MAG: hypothetical protein NC338_01345 [Firmicutes bacterium]|nr:hypothetical protein [Bacillota bacterium]MCM1401035.1 hypothetical protein [Bacteroides sp.]MCM1476954.1 hypothetical protein [Bacteroides sp.]